MNGFECVQEKLENHSKFDWEPMLVFPQTKHFMRWPWGDLGSKNWLSTGSSTSAALALVLFWWKSLIKHKG